MRQRHIPCLLLAALFSTAAVFAQTATQTPTPPAVDPLVAEIRALRTAFERHFAQNTRAQLAAGRLTLQDQRLARARAEQTTAERELSELLFERTRLRTMLADGEAESANANAERFEMRLRGLTQRMQELESRIPAAQSRAARALEVAAQEEARYTELERWLDDLDRELARQPR